MRRGHFYFGRIGHYHFGTTSWNYYIDNRQKRKHHIEKQAQKVHVSQFRTERPEKTQGERVLARSQERKWRLPLKLLIIFIIVVNGLVVSYVVPGSFGFVNLFFFPVILAGYFLSTKGGVGAAIGSALMVALILGNRSPEYLHARGFLWQYITWACILLVAGYLTGSLSDRSNRLYRDVITALAMGIETHDPRLHAHSLRVSSLAVEIARTMELSAEDQRQIALGGMLHDYGKAALHKEFLQKEGMLNDEERRHVEQHPQIASNLLATVQVLADVLPLVRYHHEHIDGEGYYGKKQKDIPLGSRIIAVADVFDALTSPRSYHKPIRESEAIEKIKRDASKHFDPKVVDAFLKSQKTKKKLEK